MFKLFGGFASLLGLLFASLVVSLTTGTPKPSPSGSGSALS